MATKVQIAKLVELDRKEQNARTSVQIGWTVVILGLLASMGANVLSSALHGFDWFSASFAVVPVLALLAVSLLLERSVGGWPALLGLGVVGTVALFVSWIHIAEVINYYGHNVQVGPISVSMWVVAWIFPIVIDVPMALAGKIVADARKMLVQIGHERQSAQTTPQRARSAPTANRTTNAKGVDAPKTTRTVTKVKDLPKAFPGLQTA